MVNRRNYLSASLRGGASGEPRRDPVAASSPTGWKARPTKACATGVRAAFVYSCPIRGRPVPDRLESPSYESLCYGRPRRIR
jgi:hypothetical protein